MDTNPRALTLAQMSRKELLAQLKVIEYNGPTSYTKERLRSILDDQLGRRGLHAPDGPTRLLELTGTRAGAEILGRSHAGLKGSANVERDKATLMIFRFVAHCFAIDRDDYAGLAEELGVEKQHVARLCNGLVRRGLLVKDTVDNGEGARTIYQLNGNECEEAQHYSDKQLLDLIARLEAGTA